jgi:hypothetical protein
VQRVFQIPSARNDGKSLKVKENEGNERGHAFPARFARDDLDVFVKPSPQAVGGATSLIRGSPHKCLLSIENRADARFSDRTRPDGHADASWDKEGKGDCL